MSTRASPDSSMNATLAEIPMDLSELLSKQNRQILFKTNPDSNVTFPNVD
jgi:hypothetical protein